MTGSQATFDFSSPIAHAVERAPAADRKRLSAQCEELLAELRRGPTTNVYMIYTMRIGNHTGRVDDLRKAGYAIECKRVKGGLFEFSLKGEI